MRNVVLEINGARHRLVPIRNDEVSCGMCSLKDYCLNQTGGTVLYCEKMAGLLADEDTKKYCLHFKLEK